MIGWGNLYKGAMRLFIKDGTMPYRRRRFYRRRRRFGGRRRFRRTRRSFRRTRSRRNGVFSYKRIALESSIVALSGSQTCAGYSFKLSDMDNSTQFTSLYDEYRIALVVARFVPIGPAASANVNVAWNESVASNVTGSFTQTSLPRIFSAIDDNDATTPSGITEIADRGNCRWSMYGRTHTRILRPKPAMAVYNGVASTGYATAPRRAWLNSSYPDVPHYGLKVGVDTARDSTFYWRVMFTYYVQFRRVH